MSAEGAARSQPVARAGIEHRLFVVGCSRSGTTLVQRCLAGHPAVKTFPESGLFLRLFGMRGRRLPWTLIGLTAGKERKALRRIIQVAGDGRVELPPREFRLSRALAASVATLDRLAWADGCTSWLEKTPRHFLHADRIARSVPRACVIHVLRDGRDVVASIVDRARRHPERFGRQARPGYGIREWNRAMAAHARCLGQPGHVFVRYEDLAAAPGHVLCELARETGLGFDAGMLAGADPDEFLRRAEAWKNEVTGPIREAHSKFRSLFTPAQCQWIERALHIQRYEYLAARLHRPAADGQARAPAAGSQTSVTEPTG